MLRRSERDIDDLIAMRARVRLCKGAYLEPASVAFPDKADVDKNYALLMERLLLKGHYPARSPPTMKPLSSGRPGIHAPAGHRGQPIRISDALRRPAGPATAAPAGGSPDAGLRAVRNAVVSLSHAPARGARRRISPFPRERLTGVGAGPPSEQRRRLHEKHDRAAAFGGGDGQASFRRHLRR